MHSSTCLRTFRSFRNKGRGESEGVFAKARALAKYCPIADQLTPVWIRLGGSQGVSRKGLHSDEPLQMREKVLAWVPFFTDELPAVEARAAQLWRPNWIGRTWPGSRQLASSRSSRVQNGGTRRRP